MSESIRTSDPEVRGMLRTFNRLSLAARRRALNRVEEVALILAEAGVPATVRLHATDPFCVEVRFETDTSVRLGIKAAGTAPSGTPV